MILKTMLVLMFVHFFFLFQSEEYKTFLPPVSLIFTKKYIPSEGTNYWPYSFSHAQQTPTSFLLVWLEHHDNTYLDDIYLQYYCIEKTHNDTEIKAVSEVIKINNYRLGGQAKPLVATDGTKYMLTFTNNEGVENITRFNRTDRTDVFGKFGLSNETEEFVVNDVASQLQLNSLLVYYDNVFVSVWESSVTGEWQAHAKYYDSVTGSPIGGEFKIVDDLENDYHDRDLDVVQLGEGRFLLLWVNYGVDEISTAGIAGQVFKDILSTPITEKFQVNTFTKQHQNHPKGALLMNHLIIVVYDGRNLNDDNVDQLYDINAQLIDFNGTKIGDEFRINDYSAYSQVYPNIGVNDQGDIFIVTWTNYDIMNSELGISAKIYHFDGEVITVIKNEFYLFKSPTLTLQASDLPVITVDYIGDDRFNILYHFNEGLNDYVYSQIVYVKEDCPGNGDPYYDCQTCLNNYIDPQSDCITCPTHWDLSTMCTECLNMWIDNDNNCSTCLETYNQDFDSCCKGELTGSNCEKIFCESELNDQDKVCFSDLECINGTECVCAVGVLEHSEQFCSNFLCFGGDSSKCDCYRGFDSSECDEKIYNAGFSLTEADGDVYATIRILYEIEVSNIPSYIFDYEDFNCVYVVPGIVSPFDDPLNCMFMKESGETKTHSLIINYGIIEGDDGDYIIEVTSLLVSGHKVLLSVTFTSSDGSLDGDDDDDDEGTFGIVEISLIAAGSVLFICVVVIAVIILVIIKKGKKIIQVNDKELEETSNKGFAKIRINKSLFKINFNEIKVNEQIGKGASATVFSGEWNSQNVALKCFYVDFLISSQEKFEKFEREVELLRFYGATFVRINPKVAIVMEYLTNGPMKKFLKAYKDKNNNETYPFFKKIRLLSQICSGMEYLHDRKVIHRDLKGSNILISEHEEAKLVDFGISRILSEKDKDMTRNIGSSYYKAPELIKSSNYTAKVDVYSFSIVLYETIFEIVPFKIDENDENKSIEWKVSSDPNYRPHINEDNMNDEEKWVLKIMRDNWDDDPDKRQTFAQLRIIFDEKVKMAQ